MRNSFAKHLAVFSIALLLTPVEGLAVKDWNFSGNLTDHPVFKGAVCSAWTTRATSRRAGRTQAARLEIIAQEDGVGGFLDPFVQVVVEKGEGLGEGVTLKSGNFRFDRLSFSNSDSTHMVFVGRLNERAKVIQNIKAKSQFRVDVFSREGQRADQISFSLRGSGATTEEQFSNCSLSFESPKPVSGEET